VGDERESQSATVEDGRTSLEVATKLGRPLEGYWLLGLFPDAAEAGGSFRSAAPRRPGAYRLSQEETADPARSAEEAARRAATRLRRYVAANRLNRLGTLTYAVGCHDQEQLRVDVGEFFRAMRDQAGEPIPYVWVPEWHPGGHGLHVHFAVGRYIRQAAIKEAWGRGIVHIKLLGDIPIGEGTLGEARKAARYLAKYVSKGLGHDRHAGLHRYECAQGFQPRVEQIVARTWLEAVEAASERMGRWPELIWQSRQAERWYGPPAVWASWDR
jgi:hypothetical protein